MLTAWAIGHYVRLTAYIVKTTEPTYVTFGTIQHYIVLNASVKPTEIFKIPAPIHTIFGPVERRNILNSLCPLAVIQQFI